MSAISFDLPDSIIDRIAARAAELVGAKSRPEPWLDVDGAAEHLACSPSRIYSFTSRREIPFHKDGKRLLFKPSELDAWVRKGGAKR